MATPKIEIAPERIAEGKHLYELTPTPVADIAGMMGISRKTLERRIPEWGWTPRSSFRVMTDRARVATVPPRIAGLPAMRRSVAERILNAVNRELDVIDKILRKAGPANKGEIERSTRTVVSTARALRELAAVNMPDEATPPHEPDPDSAPRDLDEFRAALARRIEAFIDARPGQISGPADGDDRGDQADRA